MIIIDQIRLIKGVYQLRDQILAAEEQLAQAVADEVDATPAAGRPPDAADEVDATPAAGRPPARSSVIRRRLVQLLREQAALLAASPTVRVITMLPPPARLRADADRLEHLDEPGPP